MVELNGKGYLPLHPLRWLPEIWQLGHRRVQPHLRLMLLSSVVGVVSGVGAIVFYIACQVVTHYTLAMIAGYQQASPGGEKALFAETTRTLVPWLLLVVPTVVRMRRSMRIIIRVGTFGRVCRW
jgi:hypothetical protein